MGRHKSIVSTGELEDNEAPPEINEMGGFEASDIDVISPAHLRSMAAQAAFMEEKVVVQIEDDDDPNSAVFIPSGHQGTFQYIKRGSPQTIKRKYLYSLIAAQRIKFACAFGKDQSGNDMNRMSGSGQSTYRVHLISDNNPEGGLKWVHAMMKETSNIASVVPK